MNGRERILTALNLRQADRVPVWVHAMNEASIINIGKHFAEGLPEPKPANLMTLQELLKLADTLALIHEQLEIDGITALVLGQEEELDEKHYRSEWGVVMERNPYGLAVPVVPAIKTPTDLETYRPPRPDRERDLIMLDIEQARFQGRLAQFFMIEGVFTGNWYLRGMEQLLVDFVRHRDLVHGLARLVADYALELIDMVARAGADVIIIEEDVADNRSTLMSRAHFQEFAAPYNQELVDCAHKLGLKVVYHSDGNLWPILDLLLEMGYDGLNPLQPQAGMDLKRVKDYCGDRICLLGNIDCGDLLCHGHTDEVDAAVQRAIEDAAPGGGYILCSSNTIHPGVKPENFLAMIKAGKEYGVYQ